MTFLLDTHIILWWLSDSSELKIPTKKIIQNRDNRILVSAASFWEINIKSSIGKLSIDKQYSKILMNGGFEFLEIKLSHTMRILDLPPIHSDPFDRMLVAQAMEENIKLITRDKLILKYPLNYLEA